MSARFDPTLDELGPWFEALQAWDVAVTASGPEPEVRTASYGPHPDQVVDVHRPASGNARGRVVSVHGGSFADDYTREVNLPLVRALVRQGFEVWNVEYRRARPGAGGFVETTRDVEAAVELATADGAQVAVVGHSAGGYLGAWASSLPGVRTLIALGGIFDLEDYARSGPDADEIANWMGTTPDLSPEVYDASRLSRRLPARTRHVLVHGLEDRTVSVSHSRAHAACIALSGDEVELDLLPATGHYALIDPREPCFDHLVRLLSQHASPPISMHDGRRDPADAAPRTGGTS
jgi:acetyl esterase/lipase